MLSDRDRISNEALHGKTNMFGTGGPCDAGSLGISFEEIGKKSREHVMEQMQKGDERAPFRCK